MFWILLGLFIVVTLIFVAVALFFPELVGITGQVAKEIEKEHRGDENKPPS
jgi:hypothetical protein